MLLVGATAYGQIAIPAPGFINTVAGTGGAGYNGDNIAATRAQLNLPCAIAVDPNGDLYIADTGNNRIRKVTASNGVITTAVGPGAGATDLSGRASICNLRLDVNGNIYFRDEVFGLLQMVNSAGTISTVEGNRAGGLCVPSYPCKGTRSAVAIDDFVVDSNLNIYMTESSSSYIYKLTHSNGIVNVFAGAGFYHAPGSRIQIFANRH
jgi:streptogramin lyase